MSERVQVTTNGKRILARIPWMNGAGPRKAKLVSGAKWDPENKVWTYALTMDVCRALRNVWGEDLDIEPPLVVWARRARDKERQLDGVRSGIFDEMAAMKRVPDEAPALWDAITSRSYQVTGATCIHMAEKFLLGDDPGLGKTLQALAAIIEHDCRDILIACPKSTTFSVWEKETRRWAPGIAVFRAQGGKQQREAAFAGFEAATGQRMLIVNNVWSIAAKKVEEEYTVHHRDGTESVKTRYLPDPNLPFLFSRGWDAIVIDEGHEVLASRYNIQSKHITNKRFGAMMLRRCLREGGLALALSGTPARSDLTRFWGTLNWLDPETWGSFWRFAESHFEIEDDGYGRRIGTKMPDESYVPIPLDEKRFNAALRPYYLARDKKTAAPDLPDIVFAGTPIDEDDPDSPKYVQLEMEPKQAKAYNDMVKLAEATLDGGRLTAPGVLAEITRERQFALSAGKLNNHSEFVPAAPSNKLDWIINFLDERKHQKGKVVIASMFTAWIDFLADMLQAEGHPVLKLTGATSDRDRIRNMELFQDPDSRYRIFLINIKAGGVGITLDAADDMIITDLPWISDDEKQVRDRIHRVSRIHQVTVYRLASVGTVDTWMASTTEQQRNALLSARPDVAIRAGM